MPQRNAPTDPASGFPDQANPNLLATIARASQSHTIVASADIFDASGVKLWAKNQPVSYALRQRLLERKLRQPMESCLRAVDGVSARQLTETLQRILDSAHPITSAVKPSASRLLAEIEHLPLHPVAQLLLTTLYADRPNTLEHAVKAMALSGAMALAGSVEPYVLRLTMLAGLLHDIGEAYIDPRYFQQTQEGEGLSGLAYRHLVVHPRVGHMVLSSLTDYPKEIARAVLEHHERMDGSGYPARSLADAQSELGRMLSMAEATLGILAQPGTSWAHVSFALRMIPGEFDLQWSKFAVALAQESGVSWGQTQALEPDAVAQDLSQLDAVLTSATEQAANLAQSIDSTPVARDAAKQAHRLLTQLRKGWNEMGLWSVRPDTPQGQFEVLAALREFVFRLQSIRRECLWPLNEFSDEAQRQLAPLWETLNASRASPLS